MPPESLTPQSFSPESFTQSDLQKVQNVKRKLIIDGQIIPSPFKNALFWPEQKDIKNKRRKKEKVPFVASSKEWQEYHKKKEDEKRAKEMEKKRKAEERLKRKEEKVKEAQAKLKEKEKKRYLIERKMKREKAWSSDSETEEEWVESGSSIDDISDFENIKENKSNDVQKGDFILTKFPGKKRFLNYVCVVQKVYGQEEFEVTALNVCNEQKTIFTLNEKDISIIRKDQIITALPIPAIKYSGCRLKYQFQEAISDVDG